MWRHIFPDPILHPFTPHLNPPILRGLAHIVHLISLDSHLPQRSWQMPKQLGQIDLGPASKYRSTTLKVPPNLRLLAYRRATSDLLATVITIAEPRLFPDSYLFLNRLSWINHRVTYFSSIHVDDSIPLLKSSIFPSPRYFSSGIPCTFNRFQCSSTFALFTAGSIVFGALINTFIRVLRRTDAFAFSVRRAEIAPDCEYSTLPKRTDAGSPAFCNASLRTSIISSSNFLGFNFSLGNGILLSPGP